MRNEARGGINVNGNVDSGSSDQQESSVQVTPVESAFDSGWSGLVMELSM